MPRRFGQVLGLKPEALGEYSSMHVRIWPQIEDALREAGVRNYSIFHFRGQLFSYFEYVGPPHEYAARMQRLAQAPRMREWWDLMEPMQIPLEGRASGAWWAEMQEVFHLD